MSEPNVILINRSLGYGGAGSVTGLTGIKYGDSFWEEGHAAHVCRMPLSEWRKCKQDVTNAAHSNFRKWEVDIEMPDSPASDPGLLDRIRSATPDQLDAIASCMPPVVLAFHEWHKAHAAGGIAPAVGPVAPVITAAPASIAASSTAGIHTAETLAKITNFRSLLKVAKEAGVENADGISSTAELRVAILEVQDRQSPAVHSAQGEEPREKTEPVGEYFDVAQPAEKRTAFAGGISR